MTSTAQECVSPAESVAAALRPDTVTGAALLTALPSPSWPLEFEPQHCTAPSSRRAQVCVPDASSRAGPARPTTATGFHASVVLPSPSWPSPFQPQHQTSPDAVTAQVCASPAATPTTDVSAVPLASATVTGTEAASVVPTPSWPFTFQPQQRTMPAASSAHVWSLPALSAVTPLASPTTATLVLMVVFVPLPSCPEAFVPQHRTAPEAESAHVCDAPATTATALLSAVTVTGVVALAKLPLPSWPALLRPQHQTRPVCNTAQVWRTVTPLLSAIALALRSPPAAFAGCGARTHMKKSNSTRLALAANLCGKRVPLNVGAISPSP